MKTNYKVEPEEPTLLTKPILLSRVDKRHILQYNLVLFITGLFYGFIGAVILGIILYINTDWISFYYWSIAVLVISLVWLSFNIFNFKKQIEEEPQKRQHAANEKELKRVADEAEKLTNSANNYYSNSLKLAGEMEEHLEAASNYLKKADFEFKRNIPRYFWTEIENAADHLAIYSEKVTQITRDAEGYFGTLNGRKHNFPKFIVTTDSTRQARILGTEFKNIQDEALGKDYFGMVLEHREDRKHMSYEFRRLGKSLAQAITNLGDRFENSLSLLNKSITTEIARSVEAEIESKDKLEQSSREQNQLLSDQNRILDKTQKLIDHSSKK